MMINWKPSHKVSRQWYLIVFALLGTINGLSQVGESDRLIKIGQQLASMEADFPGLGQPVEISVSEVSIQDFLRGIASANALNVSVDPDLNIRITNNFSNAPVKDIFLFLAEEYDLQLDFTGSIIRFNKYVAPPVPPEPVVHKTLDISYINSNDFLSLNLKKDTLFNVVKTISTITPRNVVLAPGLENQLVSVYIQNRPFKNALEKFAFANNLQVEETDDNFFLLTKAPVSPPENLAKNKTKEPNLPISEGLFNFPDGYLQVESKEGLLSITAENVPTSDIIKEVSLLNGDHYFMFNIPEGKSTLFIDNVNYKDFLSYLLNGTKYTYKYVDDVYLIGERKQEKLRTTELVRLENRTVESVLEVVPQELKKDVEIKEFIELNGLIISGSYLSIAEIKSFLRQIDIPVPVILIDVMIVEVQKNYNISTGISLGLGGENVPENSSGSFNMPSGVDLTLNSATLNNLLLGFEGFGFVNLGQLTPEFYASIKALEENGVLHRKSTPKLATLNGHEASLSLGNTEYYAEVNNSFIGAQNPALSESLIYKPVNADLSVSIKPLVSGDEQITLNIEFQQSNFTQRISENAPPGSQNKNFSSIIRVRNGETVLLGGLDEKSTENTGGGLPLLARIPVIKWIFGNNSRKRNKSQINIFIKPTILY